MEEKEVKTKSTKKTKIAVICAIVSIIIALSGLNVFASVSGYGNVFFMIKNLVTTGTVQGDEIFSDKEITLSYQSIEVAEGVKIQVNKLEILENQSNLYLTVKVSKSNNVLPLTYSLKSEGLKETDFEGSKKTGENFEYQEKLTVDYSFVDDELMTLYIKDKDGKTLRAIEISLDSREIIVSGESEVSKISQIELKRYLDVFSELNNGSYTTTQLIKIANKIEQNAHPERLDAPGIEEINEVIKEFYGNNALFEKVKDENGDEFEVLKLEKNSGITYSKTSNLYTEETDMSDYQNGICLDIKNISYKDGIYTVKYIYTLATSTELDGEEIENLPQYECEIDLKRNEEAKYSKYQVLNITEVKMVTKETSEVITEDHTHVYEPLEGIGHTTLDGKHLVRCIYCDSEKEEKHNFDEWYDIGGAWTLWCQDCKLYVYTEDESVVKNSGYKVKDLENGEKHTHEYVVVENPGNDYSTTLDGEHTIRCTICGEESKEKHNFDEWYDIGGAWTLWCADCKRYVYTSDKNLVKNSGYPVRSEECSHEFEVVENPGNDYKTTIDGEHTIRCTLCGEESKEKHNFEKWYDIGNGWTLWCKDCKRYIFTTDEKFVQESGYGIYDK